MAEAGRSPLLSSRGLRVKLGVAISLMSFIPVLVLIYTVVNYLIPSVSSKESLVMIGLAVLFTIVLALAGLIITRRIVEPIVNMAKDASRIADGDLGKSLTVTGEDELADLGKSINLMTGKIKNYLDELQSYSMKTKEVNIDIQKKVIVLSNLLQIGDMIAASESLGTICDTIIHKISEIDEDNFALLFLAKEGSITMELAASANVRGTPTKNVTYKIDKDYVGTVVRGQMAVVIDSSVRARAQEEAILKTFGAKNLLLIPVVVHGNGVGFIASGNTTDKYEFPPDNVELIKVLTRQLGIAIENAELSRRARELVVKDNLTGLYNDKYIRENLKEEIHRSILYQRPCSLLLFNLDNFKSFRDSHGELATEEALKKVALILVETAAGISKAARLGSDEFAVVLPEKNKKQAMEIAEEARRKIELMGHRLAQSKERPLTICGSVAENPLDGSTSDELFGKAYEGLKAAKQSGKNKIAA